MYQPEYIVELLGKHLDETLSKQETEELQHWIDAKPENQQLMNRLAHNDLLIADIRLYLDLWNDAETTDREQRILNKVAQQTMIQQPSSLSSQLRRWIPYAAALILVSVVALLYINRQTKSISENVITVKDILPGGNRATLTLEDGRTIDLNSRQSGIIVGNDITYLDGSSIVNSKDNAAETLVLKTPIGGNYKVVLPDGSQVWLNADSKLTYPSRFAATERVVKLEGEAYFDIQHQRSSGKDIPFKVISNGQTVNVLGTEFNISAYAEEAQTKTTLVNGAIEIVNLKSKHINKITPGQQAVLRGTETTINKVDVSKSTAWKYGQFSFDDKSFDQIMREMARWYNFKVQYEGGIPADQFIGNAFKTDKLGTVLRFLESSSIEYHVKLNQNDTYQLVIHHTGRKEAPLTN